MSSSPAAAFHGPGSATAGIVSLRTSGAAQCQLSSTEVNMDYLVSWEIEIRAENPIEAAKLARTVQTQPNTRATVFDVVGENPEDATRVDLTAIAEGNS